MAPALHPGATSAAAKQGEGGSRLTHEKQKSFVTLSCTRLRARHSRRAAGRVGGPRPLGALDPRPWGGRPRNAWMRADGVLSVLLLYMRDGPRGT